MKNNELHSFTIVSFIKFTDNWFPLTHYNTSAGFDTFNISRTDIR